MRLRDLAGVGCSFSAIDGKVITGTIVRGPFMFEGERCVLVRFTHAPRRLFGPTPLLGLDLIEPDPNWWDLVKLGSTDDDPEAQARREKALKMVAAKRAKQVAA